MHLHAVMMHLGRIAVPILAPDQPLRTRHREIAGDGRVMRHDVHVRLQSDTGRHGFADAVGAARDGGAAMDLIDLNDRCIGMIHRRRGIDILRVEGAREPEIAEFR